ncbi:MAG TPA: alpha/beta fold hydrolase [Chitinophagaceae bacterium]|nr:alpha/beta fold hydrolase [Chitinophagaceae bacterium]
MKIFYRLLCAGLCLAPALSYSQSREDSLARHFLDLNQAGNFDQAAAMFNSNLRAKVSPDMLKQVWMQLDSQFGPYLGILSNTSKHTDSLIIIMSSCHFENADLTLSFAFNKADQLAGYRVTGVKPLKTGLQEDSSRYRQEPSTLHTVSGNISGTLMLPSGKNRVPVALIIAGSGPTDRDGNNTMGEISDCYKLLAEGLAGNGIASLRYDKRGIGASALAMTDEKKLSLNDYISDAEGWVNQLKQDSRFTGVVIIGHSEGSLIGMMAAHKSPAEAFISLSGPGMDLESILLIQLKGQLNDTLYKKAAHILQSLSKGKTTKQVPASLSSLFNPEVQPYLISEIRLDPAKEIAKLKIPVLIVQGDNDLQITTGDARRLAQADPRATLIIMHHMTHMLKDAASTRQDNLKTYSDPSLPLDPALIPDITEFIRAIH